MLNTDVNDDIKAIKRPEGTYAIVQDCALPFTFDPAQFNPSGYEHAQAIIGKGGRGSAWMVETPAGIGVLKHYRRGGWAARLTSDRYIFHGQAYQEAIMSSIAYQTPDSWSAGAETHGGFLSFAIWFLSGRFVDPLHTQCTVVGRSGRKRDAPWTAIGDTLAGFHKAFVRHADLNANNILIGLTNL